ncbi:MAG: toprim domain-containing protein [Romboutsia timonensis]
MFNVNGMTINVEGMQLLNDLKLSLAQNGISLLGTIKPGINNIQFSCPSHKGGQEHSPSCGMSIVTQYKDGKEYPAGTVHCFTCGYTATLSEFISYCFGYQDAGMFGNKWLKANYRAELVQRARHFELPFKKEEKKMELPTIPDEELDKFRYYHDYMYERGLTSNIIEIFDIGYDIEEDAITIPISNKNGEVKWILRRNIANKFYKIPQGINKTDYLYGLNECLHSSQTTVYICESVFNALTLWRYNIPALALLGTGGGKQYDMLKSLPFRHYVLALDPDEAGEEGTKKLINHLKDNKLLSKLVYVEKGKDINDLGKMVLDLEKQPINF